MAFKKGLKRYANCNSRDSILKPDNPPSLNNYGSGVTREASRQP